MLLRLLLWEPVAVRALSLVQVPVAVSGVVEVGAVVVVVVASIRAVSCKVVTVVMVKAGR